VRPQDPIRVRRDVGRRIAELRQKADLTQDELAEILDHSVKYQQRLERGDENLSLEKLTEIANGLGARVIDLHKKPRARRPRAAATTRRRGAASKRAV
jgi:transcriptional regulator with XRE-family HTH domain